MISSYKYDDSGIRTQKTVGAVTTNYFLNGASVEAETNGTDTLRYFYDENGDLIGFNLTNATYPTGSNFYYVRNGQNDIIGIVNSAGSSVVSYLYDSWGKLISTTGTLATTIGVINPYRYRGYRYDVETGLYYVTSRYYDPNTGRFLNADSIDVLGASPMDLTDKNLFAYCDNNPITRMDDDGEFWHIIGGALIGGLVGAAVSIVSQAVSGNGINWRSVGASAVAGVVIGGLAAATGGASLTLTQTMVSGALLGGIGYGTYNLVNGTRTSLTGYAYSMAFGAAFAGISYKFSSGRVVTYKSRGSTGRTTAQNLKEQLAMKQVVSSPLSGAKRLTNITMNDKRWLASDGWAKYESIVNGIKIHFNYNSNQGVFDDFKFK
ncbi:MAG: RHS repeat-associated core domain-containing protein [Saccharofermentanales bacterium]